MPQATLDNAKNLYERAGITNPRKEIDYAKINVPFSWFEPMWMEGTLMTERGQSSKITYEGERRWTAITRSTGRGAGCLRPGSGLAPDPIRRGSATGARSGRGPSGRRREEGAGHADGVGSQYFSTWIVSSEKP